MPLTAINKIGPHEFLVLEGNPEPLKQQLEVFSRAGVDGVTLGRVGKRGVRFSLQSRVDQASRSVARQTFLAYRDLIGADPVPLKWYAIESIGENFKVVVLDVRQVACRRLLASSGGLNPPGLGYLVADWDLIAVSY